VAVAAARARAPIVSRCGAMQRIASLRTSTPTTVTSPKRHCACAPESASEKLARIVTDVVPWMLPYAGSISRMGRELGVCGSAQARARAHSRPRERERGRRTRARGEAAAALARGT
jgi:hypothetical protein